MDKGKDILNMATGISLLILIYLLEVRTGFVTNWYGYIVYGPWLFMLSIWVFNNIKNPPYNFYVFIVFVVIPVSITQICILVLYFLSPEHFSWTIRHVYDFFFQ
ncbi:hypothetical protein [Leuconostoc citreum]